MSDSSRGNILIGIIAILAPLALLAFGIYGTFSFTFTIPIIWQVSILGEGVGSLGLKRKRFRASMLTGVLTGIIVAVPGGYLLKALGITGYSMKNVGQLNGLLASYGINFSFRGEVGFRLLSGGSELRWVASSLLYCIFLVGLGEEVFWRGFIQKKIEKLFPMHASVWLAAALFGLVHSYLLFIVPVLEGIIFMCLITLAGALWGYLREYFDDIWAAAFSHGIAAFVIWRYFVFTG